MVEILLRHSGPILSYKHTDKRVEISFLDMGTANWY